MQIMYMQYTLTQSNYIWFTVNKYLQYFFFRFLDYNKLVLPIIRRKFGILFQHKNDPTHRCLIYIRKLNEIVKNNILPEYPSFTVPPLKEIFSSTDHETESLEMFRWKMLYWCLSLDTKDLEKDIKVKHDLVPYFCVKFLKEVSFFF